MDKRTSKKAALTETMVRLREQIAAERATLTRVVGVRALAVERMLHSDERAYFGAVAEPNQPQEPREGTSKWLI